MMDEAAASSSSKRTPAVEPREILQEGDAGLRISWADGRVCHYRASDLRRACPCAQCVNEWTGQRTLDPHTVADELSIGDVAIVGRYALTFKWSDGHETGIYSFRYLHELCEQKKKKKNGLANIISRPARANSEKDTL